MYVEEHCKLSHQRVPESKTDLAPSDPEIRPLVPAFSSFMDKRKTVIELPYIVTQARVTTRNQPHLCFLMPAIYCIMVNIYNLHPIFLGNYSFGG